MLFFGAEQFGSGFSYRLIMAKGLDLEQVRYVMIIDVRIGFRICLAFLFPPDLAF
jgi:hypothetical protein